MLQCCKHGMNMGEDSIEDGKEEQMVITFWEAGTDLQIVQWHTNWFNPFVLKDNFSWCVVWCWENQFLLKLLTKHMESNEWWPFQNKPPHVCRLGHLILVPNVSDLWYQLAATDWERKLLFICCTWQRQQFLF